ncbi:C1q-related factor-like [Antedon mediterranea]|uniref:C1q-related factor-like n=1 Tax=Antedon mediterranea TaxID=105859 RepID=UPI003AF71ECE
MYVFGVVSLLMLPLCRAIVISPPGLTAQRSSFSAKLRNDLSASSTENQVVVFDVLLNNVNDNYDVNTGRFNANINGTYVFYLSLMSKNDAANVAFGCLTKNGVEQSCVWSNGNGGHEMSSNTVILDLNSGDYVNVILKAGSNYELHATNGAGYCSFSGFLLYPSQSSMKQLANVLTTLTN